MLPAGHPLLFLLQRLDHKLLVANLVSLDRRGGGGGGGASVDSVHMYCIAEEYMM